MPFDAQTLKQPWVKYSLYGVAGLGAIFIAYKYVGGGGGGTSQSGGQIGIDPGLVSLQEQQNGLAASGAAAASAQSYHLALDAQQSATALQVAQIAANAQSSQQFNAVTGAQNLALIQAHMSEDNMAMQGQVATNLAQINSNNVLANIEATKSLTETASQAQVQLGAINSMTSIKNTETSASAMTNIAQMQAATAQGITAAQVQMNKDNNMTTSSLALTNAAVSMINTQSNNDALVSLGSTVSNNNRIASVTASNDALAASNTVSSNQRSIAQSHDQTKMLDTVVNGIVAMFM